MLKRSILYVLVCAMMITALPCGVFAAEKFTCDTYIQAESGSTNMDVLIESSPYASGGKTCTTQNRTIEKKEDIKSEDISLSFTVEKNQSYKVFVRALLPAGKTEFYWRWDSEDWKSASGKVTGEYSWVELAGTSLREGSHKLSLCHKYTGVKFDMLYVTADESFEPAEPDDVIPMEKAKRTYVQQQKYEYEVTGDGLVIEAEDVRLESGMDGVTGADLSGKAGIKAGVINTERVAPGSGESAALEFDFKGEPQKNYTVWARILAPNGSADSLFAAYNDKAYEHLMPVVGSEYTWMALMKGVQTDENGNVTFRMHPRESNWSVDQFIITDNKAYVPRGAVSEVVVDEVELVPITELPPVTPPAGAHPRIYFRSSDVENLKEKLNHPGNEIVKQVFEDYVSAEVTIPEKHNDVTLQMIEAKAYYYALFSDKEKGREAIELTLKVQDMDWDFAREQFIERTAGRTAYSAAIVYDWCYDLLSAEEKDRIIEWGIACASQMEQGWPPMQQPGFVGHGAEQSLLRDLLSISIAFYDERPDLWNFVGGRFYEEYVPERIWGAPAHIHDQGSNYGIWRHTWDLHAYALITGMGAEPPWDKYDMCQFAYSREVYLRRPDGMIFQEGDMYNMSPMSYTHPSEADTFLESAINQDPYLKDEFVRASTGSNKDGLTASLGVDISMYLILNDPTLERKSISNLPLSRYFGSPAGIMAARTGWDDGLESKTAVAYMNIYEYWIGNHQHKDAGNFQIYYKGPLATESGIYDIYGTYHHYTYTEQTTAHNCMIVRDPNEGLEGFSNINDGGQRNVLGHNTWEGIFTHPQSKRASVLAHEIDPQNQMEPDYTYMKGELENSYSDKVSEYERSFMFLNLKDDTVPAALIVFDRLVTSNPSFKKTWLLHGQSEPEINGSRTIWGSSPYVDDLGYKYTGKMVVDHMLPSLDNSEKVVVGGPEEGWNIINGENIPHSTADPGREENTYRLEVSPKNPSATEYFLNCIQVTDGDNEKYLDAKMIDSTGYYGVSIGDRIVMFSKAAGKGADKVEFTAPARENLKYTVCDLQKGTWKITAGDTRQTAEVTEEGGVLSFTAGGGAVSVERVNDRAADAKPRLIADGDSRRIYVKVDNKLAGMPAEPELVNDRLMVPMSDLAKRMGVKESKDFVNSVFTDESQQITVSVAANADYIVKNGERIQMDNPIYQKNGVWMIELRTLAEAFNYKVFWNEPENVACITANKTLVISAEEGYAEIKGVIDDGGERDGANVPENVLDNKLDTLWAAQGEGRWLQFELEEETNVENIEIIFNPNNRRTPFFEVMFSLDGENFETVYSGTGDSGADGKTWEVFEFDKTKPLKAKYIRYVANASNVSLWNGVKEMRFKIGTELVKWENDDSYAKITDVEEDGGETILMHGCGSMTDGINRTTWEAMGKGRYVTLTLDKQEKIAGVECVFEPETRRSQMFDIQVSLDGKSYTTVYSGTAEPSEEVNVWRYFKFDNSADAKFVRFVGKGSNMDRRNKVVEVRFKKAE